MSENKFMLFTRSEKEDGSSQADAFLAESIGPQFYYLDLLQFLYEAKEGDTCTIHIDNNGGYLVTGITIGAAIERSKAHVTTKGLSIAASAAAYIFTKGKTKVSSPWGFVMYHTASYFKYGNTKEHEDGLTYIKALIRAILIETKQEGLITDQDVEDIVNRAKDVFVPGKLINERAGKGGTD